MDEYSEYNESLELDLNKVEASLAGPKRPQDRINLNNVSKNFDKLLDDKPRKVSVDKQNF